MTDRVASSPLGKFFSPVKKSTLEVLQNEVAALTEERDFFKSKYSSQMSDIAQLEKDLKSARNQIAKLREELIAVELERAKGGAGSMAGGGASIRSETCPSTTGVLSTGNDSISREGEEIPEEEDEAAGSGSGSRERPAAQDEPGEDGSERGEGDGGGDDGKSDNEDDKSEDEVEAIRDHAAKMLIWANYQEVRSAQSTRRISSSADVSVASLASSGVRSPPVERVPRTIHASSPGSSAVEIARASARSLLGLAADEDVDDGRSDSHVEGGSEHESDSEEEEEGVIGRTPANDGVRKMLSPQFPTD